MVCDICILYAIALKVGCSMSNPVATVGLEKTFYTITENVDVVEVCVVVHSPSDIDCPSHSPSMSISSQEMSVQVNYLECHMLCDHAHTCL